MNIIILKKSDFLDENIVILKDDKVKYIKDQYKPQIGTILKVGTLNEKLGTGEIVEITKNEIKMKVVTNENPPKSIDIKLILAMPRPKVLKRVIEHSTTLGIKDIYIIKTWKVEKSYWNTPVLMEENLKKHMILGLEQSKDTILPNIQIRKRFKPFVEDELPEIIKDTSPIVAHPGNEINTFESVIKPYTIAIGPEGGFIDYEIDMLKKIGFKTISLGERILRVETAIPFILGKLIL